MKQEQNKKLIINQKFSIMKRKITLIGKFLLAAGLVLGSASWVSAQTAAPAKTPVKKTLKVWRTLKTWDFQNFAAEDLEAVKAEDGFDEAKSTYTLKTKTEKGTELKANGVTLKTTKGLKWSKMSNDQSGFGDTDASNFIIRVFDEKEAAKNAMRISKAFRLEIPKTDEYPLIGQTITVTYTNAASQKDYEGGKSMGGFYAASNATSADIPAYTVSDTTITVTFNVTASGAVLLYARGLKKDGSFDYSRGVEIKKIEISGWQVIDGVEMPVSVAYLGDKEPTFEPVYDALKAAATADGNQMSVTYVGYTADDTIKAEDYVGKYDVLVMGGTTNPAKMMKPFADNIVGKIPVLNLRAFWYGKDRMNWSDDNGANPSSANNYIIPSVSYKQHPVFAGLVDKESLSIDTIKNVWTTGEQQPGSSNFFQSHKTIKEGAPAHNDLAASGDISSVSEAWCGAYPYLLIGYDFNLKNTKLSAAGAQLYLNAITYLANAIQPAPAQYIDQIQNLTINLPVRNPNGKMLADTVYHKLKITVDSVISAADTKKKVLPDIYYTLDGSEPTTSSTKYDNMKPDSSLVADCTVKVLAVADGVKAVTKSQEFKNNTRPKVSTPTVEMVRLNSNPADSMMYVLSISVDPVNVDGLMKPATILYTTDGKAVTDEKAVKKVYDVNHPDTVWDAYAGHTFKVSAMAEYDLFKSSDVKSIDWENPTLPQVPKNQLSVSHKRLKGSASIYEFTMKTREGARIYYTIDGSTPSDKSTQYNGTIDLAVISDTLVRAIAYQDRFKPSEVFDDGIDVDTIADSIKPIKLGTPLIIPRGNNFIIEPQADSIDAGSYDYFYTVNDPNVSAEVGLRYNGPTGFSDTSKYTIFAVAAGYGYITSEKDSMTYIPSDEMPVLRKTIYQSTFNRNDPSVDDYGVDPTGIQTWGWFRWTPDGDAWVKGGKHTADDRSNPANQYIIDEEWNDGVYYDSETKPRPNIFEKGAKKGDWRHFNNWLFWSDKDASGNYRRMLVQENMGANKAGALQDADGKALATGGALYIFNSTAKGVAGPDSVFQGPFAVTANIAGGENYQNAAAMSICIAQDKYDANEMVLGTISSEAGKMATDTFSYYGTDKVYIRLTTNSKDLTVYDFMVYGPGINLPPLAIDTIMPMGGDSATAAVELADTINTFSIVLNADVEVGTGKVLWTSGPTQIECDVKAEGNVITVTLPEDAPKVAGSTYSLLLSEGFARGTGNKEGEDIVKGNKRCYYKIVATSAVDEVTAAGEVVEMHIYSVTGAEKGKLEQGVNIVKKVYSDGSVTTEKVQVK